jgi:hypothetical protein
LVSDERVQRVAIALVIVGLAAGIAAFALHEPPAVPAFPCVSTSKSGWLTASSGRVVIRVDWGAGEQNRIGAGDPNGAITWLALDEAAARARAQALLVPLSRTVHSSGTTGAVSVFVGCDGKGDYWHGEAPARPTYLGCVRPHLDRSSVRCLKDVFDERRRVTVNEAAAAMGELMERTGNDIGIRLPPDPGVHPVSSMHGFDLE